jgi:hypothetical protein
MVILKKIKVGDFSSLPDLSDIPIQASKQEDTEGVVVNGKEKCLQALVDLVNDIVAEFIDLHYQGKVFTKQEFHNLFTIKTFDDNHQHYILHKNNLIAIVDLIPQLPKGHYNVTVKKFYN